VCISPAKAGQLKASKRAAVVSVFRIALYSSADELSSGETVFPAWV
jgi:hypothetical protein